MTKKTVSRILLIASLLVFFLLFVYFEKYNFLFYVIIAVISLIYGKHLHKKHQEMLKLFAGEHGLEFKGKIDVKELNGRLFSAKTREKASSALIGNYKNYPIKIFNYSFTVGNGKNQSTHSYTLCEIEFQDLKFPHLILKSKKMFLYHSPKRLFSDEVEISLEKSFEKYYSLYTEEDYQIEALQIFTNDLLNYLVDNGSNFSIEFSNNKIYIFDDLIIRKKEELNTLYTVSKEIIDRSGELIRHLKDDFDALHNMRNQKN